MKVQLLLYKLQPLSIGSLFKKSPLTVWTVETLSLRFSGDYFLIQKQNEFSLHHWQDFSSRSMATLRNKRKLAAVLRETPEGSSSRTQNVLDHELTQDYISQVSEEIEGRVTKKLSKEFSKTESRILGALSKLDEFLLNPQVGTCSVAVPGTSRNTNWENRETTGDRSSDDPYPEVGYFSHHSGQLNSPETKTNPHSSVAFPSKSGSVHGSATYTIRGIYMNIYWGVIRIWYASTTYKGVDIWTQQYYINGNRKV